MNYWFSSDFHLGHFNIISYSHRPFRTAEEMDETIIANWNHRVKPGDTAFFLGDFAFCRDRSDKILEYRKRLNGQIHLILGNHDRKKYICQPGMNWASVSDIYRAKVGEVEITCCHFALRTWNKSHFGAWHCYGHSHGTLPDLPDSLSVDVGVDARGFCPVSFEELRSLMSKKIFKPIDHHRDRRRPSETQMADTSGPDTEPPVQ